jgi:CSLREA domain-containing protein
MNLRAAPTIVVLVAGLAWSLRPMLDGQGATFTVTKTADASDSTCGADCSLREAVTAANATVGVNTIVLPSSVYILTIRGASDDLAATGDLDVTGSLTIVGTGATSTVIDGGGIDRAFDMNPAAVPGINVGISGVTIRGGEAPLGPDSDFRFEAGGIRNSATLMLTDAIVDANIGGLGGDILNSGALTLTSTSVSVNTARGGGITHRRGRMTIGNSTASGKSTNAFGGGISIGTGTASLNSLVHRGYQCFYPHSSLELWLN